MLITSAFIFDPLFVSGSTYTFDLFLDPASQAKFARLGDIITDTNTNTYQLIAPTSTPLTDGDTVTVLATGANVLPQVDASYDSTIETVGQVDSRSELFTGGNIDTATLVSGPLYTYLVTASWNSPSESNQSDVGDSVVDSTGKEFQIVSFTNPGTKWGDSVTVEETEKVGVTPTIGQGSLFRATGSFQLYQGSEINDPARTIAYNRDNFILDDFLANISAASGKVLESDFLNNTGSPITLLRVVDQNGSGNMQLLTSISDETRIERILGVTKATVTDGDQGKVVLSGLIEDISTSFILGDELFLSPAGLLTTDEPEVGQNGFASGDFIVKIGQITKNSSNPAAKDLLVDIVKIGQL